MTPTQAGGYDDTKSIVKMIPTFRAGATALRSPSHENAFLSTAANEPHDWFLVKALENQVWGPSAMFFGVFALGVYALKYWRKLWELPWVDEQGWKAKTPIVLMTVLFLLWFCWDLAAHYYAFFMLYPLLEWPGRILVHMLVVSTFPVALFLGYAFSLGEARAKRSKMALQGSARWATTEEVEAMSAEGLRRGGVWLGDYKKKPVVSPYHVMLGAPTRAGKGVRMIIPNLLMYKGSVIVNDVKGENYFITQRWRKTIGRVWLLDPFHHVQSWDPKAKGAATNWIGRIDPYSPDAVMKATAIAEAVVIPPEGGGGDNKFFIDAASNLIKGLILWAAQLEPPHNNILTVRRILTQPNSELEQTMKLIQKKGVEGARAAAATFWSGADKVRSTIQAEANNHLQFLDDVRMAEALAENSIPWERMKGETHSVYITIPPKLVPQANRFLRLVFGQALDEQMSVMGAAKHPILYLMDEFPQLGYFKQVEDAIPVVAGYGILFWLVIQNMQQLEKTYPKWQVFLANAAQVYYRPNEFQTAENINKMLGRYSVYYKSASVNARGGLFGTGDGGSANLQYEGRDLMTTDEIMHTDKAIIKLVGEWAVLADRAKYYEDPRWKDLADPNPFMNESVEKLPPKTYPEDDVQPTGGPNG